MLALGFEPAIPAIERPQTHAVVRTATGIDTAHKCLTQIANDWLQSDVVHYNCVETFMGSVTVAIIQ